MVRLNESIKTFKGTFINDTTFVDENGKPYDLIPSVLNDPELSDEDQQIINDLSQDEPVNETPFDWQGDTETVKAKVVVDIQSPDPSKTFIDDNTGKMYQWNEAAQKFVEISEESN